MLAPLLPLDGGGEKMRQVEYLIIGGGVAGLVAAICLAKEGKEVALLEAGSYPSHKICGEFISPDALPLLKSLGIVPTATIDQVEFISSAKSFTMPLPEAAGSISRYLLDEALAKEATKSGAHLALGAKVCQVDVGAPHKIHTQEECWQSPNLIVAAGRLGHLLPPKLTLTGFKGHFEGIDLGTSMQMHLVKGGYVGVSSIGNSKVNVAGILKKDIDIRSFFKTEAAQGLRRLLASGKPLFDEWMVTRVPSFGLKDNEPTPHVYFIGDAAATIAPATGGGLAMAIHSGYFAAQFAKDRDWQGFTRTWNKTFSSPIRAGNYLHRLFLSPILSSAALTLLAPFAPLTDKIFRATRATNLKSPTA